MLLLNRPQTTPAFNIAAEELMLKHSSEDCFALWRDEPCVIIGKHQNAMAEIDLDYVNKNEIPVVRRLSGGGAVFHDLGNICFTFVKHQKDGETLNFEEFTRPVIDVLQNLGIDAKFEGRNDITIDHKKFSGNAKAVYKNAVLFHGTILFSSKITDLSQALKADPSKFDDKAVKSVRSRVTNISDHLKSPLDVNDFIELLTKHFLELYPDTVQRDLNARELAIIDELIKTKYACWDWNFGQSPKYSYEHKIRSAAGGSISAHINMEHGKIALIRFHGDFFSDGDIAELENLLIGKNHEKQELTSLLGSINYKEYFMNITLEELIEVIFG